MLIDEVIHFDKELANYSPWSKPNLQGPPFLNSLTEEWFLYF